MATRKVDHLLIGGGIASASAARRLRDAGAEGSIAIVAREFDAPYHRPPASKEYLQGRATREQALIRPVRWYADNAVELLTRTSVLDLQLENRVARLSTKEEIEFGQVLLATGAMVRRLTVEGSQLQGVHYLRTLGNADSIRADTEAAERVVLIGGSYIACEVAASLTTLGRRCTMVMLESVTLERSFGVTAGRFFQDVLESHGVEVIGPEEVGHLEGDGSGDDVRVARVALKSGRVLVADAVVAGVGATPDVALARKAGLTLGELGGVVVDSRLETAVAGVFAAGDIAEYDSVVHRRVMRIEHEDVAEQQGRTVAANMLGRDVAHDTVPYFFSDLADWASLEYVGPASRWNEEIIRGSIQDGRFCCWYLLEDRVVAALSVGMPEVLDHARRLIRNHTAIGDAKRLLGDPDGDLASLG